MTLRRSLPQRWDPWLYSLLALFFRLWHLSQPKGLVFDEIYYVKDARSLLHHGVELTSSGGAEFMVHPPVGKWLIAVGIKIFGFNEFGWRFSAAVIGSLSVALIYLTSQKLFANRKLSSLAALLMLCDGLELVHSRTSLLDIFLMFFLLLALYAIIDHRHWLAGISFGLAIGSKWSGSYELIAIIPFIFYMEWRKRSSVFEYLARAFQYIFLPFLTYLLTWSGWLITSTGFDRHVHKNRFLSLLTYHQDILHFHQKLTTSHPYSANPWSWLIQARPTAFYYQSPNTCGALRCSQEVLALGTPLLWWCGTVAIFTLLGLWIAHREWRSGIILLALFSEYLPWFLFQKRTMFNFYSLAFEPAMILAIIALANRFLNGACDDESARFRGRLLMGFAGLIVLNFLYFLPLYIGTVIPYGTWLNRMWLPSWI